MNAKSDQNYLFVVLGIHKDGRSRAAVYPSDMAEVASKAAENWKLRLAKIDAATVQTLSKDLPKGPNHPSNKVDAPVVKREIYNLLLQATEGGKLNSSAPSSPQPTAAASSTNPWDAIEIGGTVLWQADPSEGYFPCTVVGMSKDRKLLTLKWIGYEKLPTVTARRVAVGLIAVVK